MNGFDPDDGDPAFKMPVASNRYVAFLDVLGFGNKVLANFLVAKDQYELFVGLLTETHTLEKRGVSFLILSDSIVLTSATLLPLLLAARNALFGSLLADCLLRGGIARGAHAESRPLTGSLFYVSEPLVNAVNLEKQISNPCVALHASAFPSTSETALYCPPLEPNLNKILLFYRQMWIVNPFNIAWSASARHHAERLLNENPQYGEKYNWFLGLHEAVVKGPSLHPPE